jgi:hypothetical protein
MTLALVMMTQGAGPVLLLAPCLGIPPWGQSASPGCWGSALSFSVVRKEVGCHGEN